MDRPVTMVDPRQPRLGQGITGVVPLGGFLLDVPAVLPTLTAILAAASLLGPRANPYVWLSRALQRTGALGPPRELEEASPPRFANTVGYVVLGAATLGRFAFELGWVAWALALLVAALALLAAITGLCVGCDCTCGPVGSPPAVGPGPGWCAWSGRRRDPRGRDRLGAPGGVCGVAPGAPPTPSPGSGRPGRRGDPGACHRAVHHGFLGACRAAVPYLEAAADRTGVAFRQIDVGEHPDLARRFGIRTVPTIALTGRGGRVLRVWTEVPDHGELTDAAGGSRG